MSNANAAALTLQDAEELRSLKYKIHQFKVHQLKELCKQSGLGTKGRKQELIDRLNQLAQSLYTRGLKIEVLALQTMVLKLTVEDEIPPLPRLVNTIRSGVVPYHQLYESLAGFIGSSDASVGSYVSMRPQPTQNGTNLSHTQRPNAGANMLWDSQTPRVTVMFQSTLFYALRYPVGTTRVLKASKGRAELSLMLDLNSGHKALLDQGPHMKVYLFCCMETTPDPKNAVIQYPPLQIYVNQKLTEQNVRGIKGKPGTARPADLTPYVRDHRGPATVRVVYSDAAERYLVDLYVVETFSPASIITQISNKPHISAESTRQAIRDENELNEIDDIVVDNVPLSLRCPITYARIKIPVKSIQCDHVQCFDGLSFLMMQEKIPVWQCPCCSKLVNENSLVVSDYLQAILDGTSEDVDTVRLHPDGSWTPIKDEDEAKTGVAKSENTGVSPEVPSTAPIIGTTIDDSIEIISLDSESEAEGDTHTANDITMQPADDAPAATESLDIGLPDIISLETEPAITEPVVTEPLLTEPVVTEPMVTEPMVAEPIETQQMVTGPTGGAEAVPELAGPSPSVGSPSVGSLIAEQNLQDSQNSQNLQNPASSLPAAASPENAPAEQVPEALINPSQPTPKPPSAAISPSNIESTFTNSHPNGEQTSTDKSQNSARESSNDSDADDELIRVPSGRKRARLSPDSESPLTSSHTGTVTQGKVAIDETNAISSAAAAAAISQAPAKHRNAADSSKSSESSLEDMPLSQYLAQRRIQVNRELSASLPPAPGSLSEQIVGSESRHSSQTSPLIERPALIASNSLPSIRDDVASAATPTARILSPNKDVRSSSVDAENPTQRKQGASGIVPEVQSTSSSIVPHDQPEPGPHESGDTTMTEAMTESTSKTDARPDKRQANSAVMDKPVNILTPSLLRAASGSAPVSQAPIVNLTPRDTDKRISSSALSGSSRSGGDRGRIQSVDQARNETSSHALSHENTGFTKELDANAHNSSHRSQPAISSNQRSSQFSSSVALDQDSFIPLVWQNRENHSKRLERSASPNKRSDRAVAPSSSTFGNSIIAAAPRADPETRIPSPERVPQPVVTPEIPKDGSIIDVIQDIVSRSCSPHLQKPVTSNNQLKQVAHATQKPAITTTTSPENLRPSGPEAPTDTSLTASSHASQPAKLQAAVSNNSANSAIARNPPAGQKAPLATTSAVKQFTNVPGTAKFHGDIGVNSSCVSHPENSMRSQIAGQMNTNLAQGQYSSAPGASFSRVIPAGYPSASSTALRNAAVSMHTLSQPSSNLQGKRYADSPFRNFDQTYVSTNANGVDHSTWPKGPSAMAMSSPQMNYPPLRAHSTENLMPNIGTFRNASPVSSSGLTSSRAVSSTHQENIRTSSDKIHAYQRSLSESILPMGTFHHASHSLTPNLARHGSLEMQYEKGRGSDSFLHSSETSQIPHHIQRSIHPERRSTSPAVPNKDPSYGSSRDTASKDKPLNHQTVGQKNISQTSGLTGNANPSNLDNGQRSHRNSGSYSSSASSPILSNATGSNGNTATRSGSGETRYSRTAFDSIPEKSASVSVVRGILGIELSKGAFQPSRETTPLSPGVSAVSASQRSTQNPPDSSSNMGHSRQGQHEDFEQGANTTFSPLNNSIKDMAIGTPVNKKRTVPGDAMTERSWNKKLSRQGSTKNRFDPTAVRHSEIIELDD